jgi:O-antigen ligase
LWLGVAAGAFLLVLLSTSKTALLASMLGVGVIGAGVFARRGPVQAVLAGAGVLSVIVIGASIVFLAPDLLVGAIGRDLTLTGRTDIWAAAAPAVAASPWLGYGYYAFWLPDNGPAYWVRETVNWPVASAHSGWLEMGLGMGRIGVALMALQLAVTLLRGARAFGDAIAGLWAPAFLVVFAMYTMSESHALQANNLFWIIYTAVAARLALDVRKART